jgi:ribose-phosphate pyrophosphokinase
MRLFALEESRPLAERIASELETALSPLEDRRFEDGEHKARPLINIRGDDVVLVQSLHSDDQLSANDKLCRLMFLIATMRDLGAAHITAVIPYLAYARKDRRTKPHDPLTGRYVAQAIEAMGVDLVISMEVHNPAAFENAFRCPTISLTPHEVFAAHIAGRLGDERLIVLSPDPGGVKRAQLFAETLQETLARPINLAYVEKRRSAGIVSGELLVGEVEGATVLIVDDLISTGGTMLRAAEKCRDQGAQSIYALAAHGLFNAGATKMVTNPLFEKVIVSDTVPPFRLAGDIVQDRVEIISVAPVFANTLRLLR